MAYKLELPIHSRTHNFFHCSFLKLHVGLPPPIIDYIPHESTDNHPLVIPLVVLEVYMQIMDEIPTRFALVEWCGLSPDDTSWENGKICVVITTLRTRLILLWEY